MNRSIIARLEQLEQAQPEAQRRVFRVIGDSVEECDARISELKRDQGATDDDLFITRLMVDAVATKEPTSCRSHE